MLVKEWEEMEKILIGLRQEGSYQNKIEDLEDEVQVLQISYEDQQLYEVKEQLNKLKDEVQYTKNAICSR